MHPEDAWQWTLYERPLKTTMKYFLLIVIVMMAWSTSIAQQDTLHVRVLANVKKDVIQLRWAVNSPAAWKQTNRYGFRIERYTAVRNNEILAKPEKVVLTPEVLKPQPLDNWEALATSNNYAAIIAQALYGEEFQLSGDDTKGVSKFIALAQELEQRYMVAMYAADLCYPAALLAGWGFEDRSVKPGERYLYRVIPALPEKGMRIESGSVYVSLNEYQPLPQPQELTALFGDKSVMLTWNYGILNTVYNSYHIEKSHDGKTFTRLSDIPFMNMNNKDGKPADRMYYIDSLANNTVKAYYRIVGVTAFSEEGPPSEVVTGEGKNMLIYVPHITRAVPDGKGAVHVEWEFDERGNTLIRNFELQLADNDKGPFVPVSAGIMPEKRNITYDKLQASNYFVIAAIPREGEPVRSMPVLVQPIDSIPPSIPSGLTGIVDSLGVVKLSWNSNNEQDLLGYRIYRAQTQQEELIPLNDIAVHENHFTDTIEVRNLNSQIFYAVTAVDMRYNQSKQSPSVALQKPDLVPPSPPVITNYKVTDAGVLLQWVTGEEENIATLNLYRLEKATNDNKLIKTFSDLTVRQFTDSTTASNKAYGYTVTAVTARGLASDPSPMVTVKTSVLAHLAGKITGFTAKVNKKKKHVELSWTHDITGLKGFELYKGEVGKPVSLWKVVKAYELQLEDQDVKPGMNYEYIVRAILENGKSGAVSKTTTGK